MTDKVFKVRAKTYWQSTFCEEDPRVLPIICKDLCAGDVLVHTDIEKKIRYFYLIVSLSDKYVWVETPNAGHNIPLSNNKNEMGVLNKRRSLNFSYYIKAKDWKQNPNPTLPVSAPKTHREIEQDFGTTLQKYISDVGAEYVSVRQIYKILRKACRDGGQPSEVAQAWWKGAL